MPVAATADYLDPARRPQPVAPGSVAGLLALCDNGISTSQAQFAAFVMSTGGVFTGPQAEVWLDACVPGWSPDSAANVRRDYRTKFLRPLFHPRFRGGKWSALTSAQVSRSSMSSWPRLPVSGFCACTASGLRTRSFSLSVIPRTASTSSALVPLTCSRVSIRSWSTPTRSLADFPLHCACSRRSPLALARLILCSRPCGPSRSLPPRTRSAIALFLAD